MAIATGAHSSYDEPIATGGNREDLSDVLWDVSPTETPFITSIGKNKATATSHDWLTDTLADVAANAHIEGNDAVGQDVASRWRLSNYTQILSKIPVTTGTQEKVLKGGGIKSEMAYSSARRMKEMKRDCEYAMVGVKNAKVAGDETTAREMGSFYTYLGSYAANSNVGLPGSSMNVGAGAGVAPKGDGTDVGTVGTLRDLDEDLFKAALQTLWQQSGGNENVQAVCNATHRGIISDFTSAGTRYVTTDDKKLTASIDIYDGDYHTVTVTPDRYCLADTLFIVDKEYAKVSDLRPIHSYDLAKAGDSYRKQIVWETTLEVSNPRGHMGITDLN